MTETDDSRRRSDVEIHHIAGEVAALKATQMTQGQAILDIGNDLKKAEGRIFQAIDKLREGIDTKTRQPMLPYVTLLIVAGGFLLTIISLVMAPVMTTQSRHENEITEHLKGGHPDSVRELFMELLDAHDKNFERIRQAHHKFKDKDERFAERLTKLETEKTELVARFKSILDYREKIREMASEHRWTAKQQEVFEKGLNHRLNQLESERSQ